MADGTIIIDTDIDASGIEDGMEEAIKGLKSGTSEMEQVGSDLGEAFSDGFNNEISNVPDAIQGQTDSIQQKLNSFSGSMTKLGGTLSLAVTAPLVGLGGKMVESASNLEENLNKIDVAFGTSSEKVKEWADTATESFGLSKNQALEATALFGDMATSMGIPQEEASNMSTSLAGLAGDLASFKNIDIGQAMTALNGVFTGETESLKTLGVVMTETNLEEFADDLGLVYKEMSQAEKVQLRYNYVMDKTANAQGDYSRTADGTANSMRTFEASAENLSSTLGQNLLPLITPIVQKLTELVNKFGELDPGMQKAIVSFGLIAAAIGPVLTVVGGITSAFGALSNIFSALNTTMGGIGLVIAGVSTAVSSFFSMWENGFSWLNEALMLIGIAIAAVGAVILGAPALVAGVVAAIVAVVATLAVAIKDNWDKITEVFNKFDTFLNDVFKKDFTEMFGPVLGEILNGFFANVENIWNSIKEVFNGIITFIEGVFEGDWKKAWEGVKDALKGVWDLIVSVVKTPINAIISLVNGLIGGIESGVNYIIEALNSVSFDIPEWVPKFGGEVFSLGIPEIELPRIPHLATGAVIPPNNSFLAVLGDQRRGVNIETPLDTMIDAFKQAIKEMGGVGNNGQMHVTVEIDGRVLGQTMVDLNNESKAITGRPLLT